MAPVRPVEGSIAVGLNWLCCPYLVLNGDSYCQRMPRLRVNLGVTFQSSWKYPPWLHQRGRDVAKACVKVALVTAPSMKLANWFPVRFRKGNSVPPKL